MFDNDLFHANFFFFFTTAVVAVIGFVAIIALLIITKILLDIRYMVKTVRKNLDRASNLIEMLGSSAGASLGGIISVISKTVGSRFSAEPKRARKKS